MGKNHKMKADEMQIKKAVYNKVSDDVLLVATYQYHVEEDPATGKKDHSKSKYRWLARAYSVPELKERIRDLSSDAKRLEAWHWPDDPSWDKKMFTNDSTNYAAAKWLTLKISKALSWDEGMKILNGWDKKTSSACPKNAYDVKDYVATDGSTVDLTDRDAILKHVNQNFFKPKSLKTQIAI